MRTLLAGLLAVLAGCGKADPPSAPATEAQRLLAEAGFPGGTGFPRLTLLYNTADVHKKIAAAVQEMWRTQLGVTVDLLNAEWKVYIDRIDRADYDLARRAWIGEYMDASAFLELFRRETRTNTTGWSSDAYEGLMERSAAELDPARRTAIHEEAETLLLAEAPLAPLYHYVAHNYVKPFVKGVHHNARDMHPLQQVRLEGPGAPADGILVFNAGEEPHSLDPALSHDIAGLKVLMHLFEGLAGYDPRDASPVPAAAEGWDVAPDGKTYTFRLREAHWSNGDPVTAHDFVYAWRRVVAPGTASAYVDRMFIVKNARAIVRGTAEPAALGVRAAGDRTLVVELEHPASYFPQLLCLNLFYPVHRATVEKHGPRWSARPETIVHNGPYRLVTWKVGDRKVFEKNPRYRAPGEVRLERFVFLSVPDDHAAFRMYEAGQIHWLFRAPTDFMDMLVKRADHMSGPYNGVYFYAFNTRRKPLDDVRVRRALSMVIDREKIARFILRGGELPAGRLLPPTAR